MINVTDKTQCTGCTACNQVCAHSAINMMVDEYGHTYPKVDINLCVDCGLCNKVCPLLHKERIPKDENLETLHVLAVYNRDNEVRKNSTSGGIFTILANFVISKGGIVFAARFDEKSNIVHSSFESMDDIDAFRGSKYAQSNLNDAFRSIRNELRNRPVLFVGTPCQVAGLKSFLIKDYSNLYTCDFVCMGISSQNVWKDYLTAYWSSHDIEQIFFKDKREGWHQWKMLIKYDNGKEYLQKGMDDPFFYTYLTHLTYRPSCLQCSFRTCRRLSDFTIADCWGIDKVHPEFDDNKGCTTLILQTDKAKDVFDAIKANVYQSEYSIDDVKAYNPYIVQPISSHPRREDFYKLYIDKGFKAAAEKYCKPTVSTKQKINNVIKRITKL